MIFTQSYPIKVHLKTTVTVENGGYMEDVIAYVVGWSVEGQYQSPILFVTDTFGIMIPSSRLPLILSDWEESKTRATIG